MKSSKWLVQDLDIAHCYCVEPVAYCNQWTGSWRSYLSSPGAGLQGWGIRPGMCRVQWVSPLLALLGGQGRLGIVVLRVSLGGPCDLLATRNAGRGEAQEMEGDRN